MSLDRHLSLCSNLNSGGGRLLVHIVLLLLLLMLLYEESQCARGRGYGFRGLVLVLLYVERR